MKSQNWNSAMHKFLPKSTKVWLLSLKNIVFNMKSKDEVIVPSFCLLIVKNIRHRKKFLWITLRQKIYFSLYLDVNDKVT